LLTGIGTANIAKTKYYAPIIDVTEAKKFFEVGTKVLCKIASRVAKKENLSTKEYLMKLTEMADEYACSDDFHGRVSLVKSLRNTCDSNGEYVCLLGGLNTGKSKMLESLANERSGCLLLVDLRRSSVISYGLLSALSTFPSILNKLDKEILRDSSEIDKIRHIITTIAENAVGQMTIILDEANIAFDIDERMSDIDRIKCARETLHFLSVLTMKRRKVTEL
jgi:hypothetical protein